MSRKAQWRIFSDRTAVRPQGTATAKPPIVPSQDIQERIQRAATVYEEALRAQRDGDWSAYGEAIRRLGEILKPR